MSIPWRRTWLPNTDGASNGSSPRRAENSFFTGIRHGAYQSPLRRRSPVDHLLSTQRSNPVQGPIPALSLPSVRHGRYALYLNNRKAGFLLQLYAEFIDCVRGNVALPAQRWAHLRFAFEHRKPTGGTGTLMVEDSTVGQGQIRRTNLRMFSVSETFDIARTTVRPSAPSTNPQPRFPVKFARSYSRLT